MIGPYICYQWLRSRRPPSGLGVLAKYPLAAWKSLTALFTPNTQPVDQNTRACKEYSAEEKETADDLEQQVCLFSDQDKNQDKKKQRKLHAEAGKDNASALR